MKIWTRIVGTLYVISGIIFIFLLLSIFANEGNLENFSNFLKTNSQKVGLFSTVLLIIGIIWIVNWFDYIYRTKSISFDNPGGKVKVSLKAIEDYITSMILSQIDGIKGIKVKVNVTSKGLETKISLKLTSGLNIPEVCGNIQELTKNYLQDAVGIERISSIEVYVLNILREEGQNIEEKDEEES